MINPNLPYAHSPITTHELSSIRVALAVGPEGVYIVRTSDVPSPISRERIELDIIIYTLYILLVKKST